MASMKDVPGVVKKLGVLGFAKKVWGEVTKDDVFTWGSALAYAWIFAIFPFLIFVLSLAPYLPGDVKKKTMDEISNAAYSGLGGQGGYQIVESVNQVMNEQKGGLLSFGLLIALWGASGGMTMTMTALDKAYYVACSRSFIKQRAIAIGLTIGSAVLILCVLLLLPVGTQVIEYLSKVGHLGTVGIWLVNIVRYVVALGLLFGIVSMIYYFGPCIKQKWQAVTPGAVFTVVVWVLAGFGFAYYVANFGNFNKTYGVLGGAIVLLLFFYLSAVVLLVGAEVNSVIDFEALGVKPGATDFTPQALEEKGEAEARKKAESKKGGETLVPAGILAARANEAEFGPPGKRKAKPSPVATAAKWLGGILLTKWVVGRVSRMAVGQVRKRLSAG